MKNFGFAVAALFMCMISVQHTSRAAQWTGEQTDEVSEVDMAFAAPQALHAIPLVSITALDKKFKDQIFYMGINEIQGSHQRVGMFFKNTYRKANPCTLAAPRFVDNYSFDELRNPKIVISSKKDDDDCVNDAYYQIVEMKMTGDTLMIGFKQDARQGDDGWFYHSYKLECDESNNCRVRDLETQRYITRVQATIHRCFFGTVPCGIDKLIGS